MTIAPRATARDAGIPADEYGGPATTMCSDPRMTEPDDATRSAKPGASADRIRRRHHFSGRVGGGCQTHRHADPPRHAAFDIRHDDPRLRYRGAVSLERGPGWTAPWRLPHAEAALYLPEGGLGRAAMPSGVCVALRTDSASLVCRYQADPAPRLNGPGERARLDVLCDGRRAATVELETHGPDGISPRWPRARPAVWSP